MGLVATGQITIADLNDGLNLRLSLASCLVPTNEAGEAGDFRGCVTTASVFMGLSDQTAQWTITAVASVGLTGSLTGQTYTVTAMTTDTGFVDFTASAPGKDPITARFSVAKARQGVPGPSLILQATQAGFTFTDDVASPTDQTIVITALRYGTTAPVFFFLSNGAPVATDNGQVSLGMFAVGLPSASDGSTCYVSVAQLGEADQVYVTARCGDLTAVHQITRLSRTTARPGATRNVFRGVWTLDTIYALGDTVTNGGRTWEATGQHTATALNAPPAPPATTSTFWQQAAAQGERLPLLVVYAVVTSSWSDATANLAITSAGASEPILRDVVVLYNTATNFSQTRVYSAANTWSLLGAFFNGDVLVDGTIVARHLSSESVTTQALKAGSVTSSKMVLVPGEMVSNSKFQTGDFTDWRVWSNASRLSVIPRATSGVPANAPTMFVGLFDPTALTVFGLFTGSPSYTDTGSELTVMPLSPGRSYRVSLFAAGAGGFVSTGTNVRVHYLLASGSKTTFANVLNFQSTLTTSWQEFTGTFIAPAEAVGCWIQILATPTALGQLYFTGLSVSKMNGAELYVDGSITSASLATTSLITASSQLGNAVVTTLKIGNQAVTVPVYAHTVGAVNLPDVGVEVTIQTLVINRKGVATMLQFSTQFSGVSNYAETLISIRRAGVLLTTFGSGTGPSGAMQSVAGNYVDTDTGTGNTTYTLTAQRGPTYDEPIMQQRYFSAHQFQR